MIEAETVVINWIRIDFQSVSFFGFFLLFPFKFSPPFYGSIISFTYTYVNRIRVRFLKNLADALSSTGFFIIP